MTVSLLQHHSVQSFTPGSMELTTATFCGTYLEIDTVLKFNTVMYMMMMMIMMMMRSVIMLMMMLMMMNCDIYNTYYNHHHLYN